MIFTLGFILGFAFGIVSFIVYGMIKLNKFKTEKEDLFNKLHDRAEELENRKESILKRLTEASEIAQQQMDLKSAAEQPSKNQLHSKYKNGLVYEIQELEQRKLAILQSILNDGFDPNITVLNEHGEREEMSLSKLLGKSAKESDGDVPPVSTDPNAPRRVGKFIVYTGGKDRRES